MSIRDNVRVKRVVANNHKHAFEVWMTGNRYCELPYDALDLVPTAANPIVETCIDREIDRMGFTYRLASGDEDTVLADAALYLDGEPEMLEELAVLQLTSAARDRMQASGQSAAQIARRLGTSRAQLARLLDVGNRRKTANQLIRLLAALGYEVEFDIRPRRSRPQERLRRHAVMHGP